MAGPEKRAKPLTFQELTELRRKTEAVSKFLQEQLAAHLETLRPVLSPERVFSKFLGTKGDQTLADRAFAPAPAELPAVLRSPVRRAVGVRSSSG